MRRPLRNPKSKRGFVGDTAIVIGLLFAFALIAVIAWKVLDEFNDEYQTTDASVESKDSISGSAGRFVSVFDSMFLFILFGLTVALFLSTSYIDTRPEFFFVTIIASVIFVGLAASVSNAYESFSDSDGLSGATNDFVIIPAVMDRLPLVVIVFVVAVLMGLYFKSGRVF